jgi:hypothetical protein
MHDKRHASHHTYDDTAEAHGHTHLAGEHMEGAAREHEEEARKNHYMAEFHPDHEGFHEGNGTDRNKEGLGASERSYLMPKAR